MKKTIGYILLGFSFVPWAVIPLLPFLEMSKGQIVVATTILIIAAQGAFIASIALLGKETWEHIKAIFRPK